MNSFYFAVIKLKKNFLSIIVILFVIFLCVYSNQNIEAVKEGLSLWVNNVIPSLFPFFIATEILCKTNFINILGKILQKPVSKLFNVPGEGVFPLIMGTISGYPSGAKIVSNLKKDKILSEEEAERLISFTNNSGPLFILGTVGVSLIKNKTLGYILLISHIISCLIVGIIFRNWKKTTEISRKTVVEKEEKNISIKDFGEILGDSIRNSIATILNIGGFIVFFSVVISILNSSGFFNFTSFIFEKLNISSDIRKWCNRWNYRAYKWC